MTILGSSKERAAGTIIYMTGRVIDTHGAPVANATLETGAGTVIVHCAVAASASEPPKDWFSANQPRAERTTSSR